MSTTIDTTTAIGPFKVEISQEQIDNLRRRLEATRWPTTEVV
jgi:Epoxide hydrolase N terminus